MTGRLVPIYGLIATLAITTLVYWSGLSGDFEFDDQPVILNNPAIMLPALTLDYLIDAAFSFQTDSLGRPLAMASFALNHYFFGPQAYSFKLTNLIIHLLSGVLVFLFSRRLLELHRQATGALRSPSYDFIALFTAAFWLLHPINLSPVLYVVQRMTSLSSMFTLACICSYLYARTSFDQRKYGAFGFWGGAFIITGSGAFLSKEIAILLPFYLLAVEIFLLNWSCARPITGSITKLFVTILGAVPILVTVLFLLKHPDWLNQTYAVRTFSVGERLLTEARVIWQYLLEIILPDIRRLGIYHDDIVISKGLLSPPSTLFAVSGLAGLVALVLLVRKRAPVVSFALAWFFSGHLLESTFLSLELMHEHRNYLPSIGPLFAIAYYILPSHETDKNAIKLRWVLALCFLCALSFQTAIRSASWGDLVVHAQTEARHHPRSHRANYQLGRVYLMTYKKTQDAALLSKAAEIFHESAVLDDRDTLSLSTLLYIGDKFGHPIDVDVTYRELLNRYRHKHLLSNSLSAMHLLLTQKQTGSSRLSDSQIRDLIEAVQHNPNISSRNKSDGLQLYARHTMATTGDWYKAHSLLEQAIELAPNNRSLQLSYAKFLLSWNRPADALEILHRLSNSWLGWTRPSIAFYKDQAIKALRSSNHFKPNPTENHPS